MKIKKLICVTVIFALIIAVMPSTMANETMYIGDVLYSDITAYINGHAIPTSVIDGKTLIVVEDLANYGFNVGWDGAAKTLSVARISGKEFNPLPVTADAARPGTFKTHYVYTDIKTFLSGTRVNSYALDGVTLIDFDDLGRYGSFTWDGAARAIKLELYD